MSNTISFIMNEAMRNQEYHNHKETMAWVATAAYITGAIAAGWVTHNEAESSWIPLIIIGGVVLTGLAIWFICWQFGNRKIAADRVKKLVLMVETCLEPIPKEDCSKALNAYFECVRKHPIRSQDTQLISLLAMGLAFTAFLLLVCSTPAS